MPLLVSNVYSHNGIDAIEAHHLIQPDVQLHSVFIELARELLDPLANSINALQDARRSTERSRKRKRRSSELDGAAPQRPLGIRKIYTVGFDAGQVWHQAAIVLDAARPELESQLFEPEILDSSTEDAAQAASADVEVTDEGTFEGRGEMLTSEDDDEDDKDDNDTHNSTARSSHRLENEQVHEVLQDSDQSNELDDVETKKSKSSSNGTHVKDEFGLNDGFFSIDDFNKQSQFLEEADSRGVAEDDLDEEEEIDWTADPQQVGLQAEVKNTRKTRAVDSAVTTDPRTREEEVADDDEDDNDEDAEGEEDGPVFADMEDDYMDDDNSDSQEMDSADGMNDNNTNNVFYSDFFAAPTQSVSSSRKRRANDRIAPTLASERQGEVDEDDMERAKSAVHRDLFDDVLTDDEEPSVDDDVPGRRNLSSHEKRQFELRAEIRTLEAANVSSKPWTLTGETLAPARPLNSLLEEDLDFERAGKPVPLVTDTVHEDMEALIKKRILAMDFDEIVRRRPSDLVTGAERRRGRALDMELSDSKPSKGLADEYAEEHQRLADPGYVDSRSEALMKKHVEIEQHWQAMSSQLDALCNWHHKPRPPQAGIEVRIDAPRLTMEEARPNAATSGVSESLLAPQEVYKTGDETKQARELRTRGGLAVNKEEDSRDQAKRRRRRQKERSRKETSSASTAPAQDNGVNGKKKAGRAEVLSQLRKGNVKIIGKDGKMGGIDGKSTAKAHRVPIANELKL